MIIQSYLNLFLINDLYQKYIKYIISFFFDKNSYCNNLNNDKRFHNVHHFDSIHNTFLYNEFFYTYNPF